ncbi:AAA family ATPase [Candidatus Fukatsuia symbiotica]|uniref:ATP-binding protein n=1 Tax=Candidatus Fukatsuia symbiotica TaxID=1878942 RepID=A0A2U8I7I1_9GAMM|nr:AAA family ATPase [Candidatus Fukatsuia symbiotica]AWK14064.1 ATP-binding protein [Candidatus Fukatsuia symbiotica]AWK14145.1 ATP-binding protein [Candidatus Fukatsuia symbiotica]MEA9446173.1 AAA family ATPase [Candidatus Fukatsuia symbiotica]
MGTATLILGESGTGKSASLRNLNPKACLLIQPINKPLPFRSSGWLPWDKKNPDTALYVVDIWHTIMTAIGKAHAYGKKIVIIDDFQYVMAHEFMRRADEKSYDKFTEIGGHAWNIIYSAIHNTPPELRIYFLSHTEETASGKTKIKTIGKMLDEKITLEGMFTLVLRTCVKDGRYVFTTQNDGADTVKSPMGMFDRHEIDNDLAGVDATVCHYYHLDTGHNTEGHAA